jgi:rhodanese-related sulfurtransferase
MPTEIDRHEVQRLLGEGGQLVDVMSASEYSSSHIAGAMNVPLPKLPELAAQKLDHDRPVITYCYDSL